MSGEAKKQDGNEQKLQELYVEFQSLQQQIQVMQQQVQMLDQQHEDMSSTVQSLEEFSKLEGKTDMWIPLASGIYAKATVEKLDKVLVSVGSGVAVKKDIPGTKRIVQDQLDESQKLRTQMQDQMKSLSQKMQQLQEQMRPLLPQQ